MAINDIVQTIAEARVDARSLSEFVFKPANFIVSRRLAPSINTLQYYIDKANSVNNAFSKSVSDATAAAGIAISAANTANQNAIGLIDSVTSQASQSVQNAIAGVAIDANLVNDSLIPISSITDGASARTQLQKNRENISLLDFFTRDEYTAYLTNKEGFDVARPLQEFFDYITANNVGTAYATGVFSLSSGVVLTNPATKFIVGDLTLRAIAPIDVMLTVNAGQELKWQGAIHVRGTGSYSYASRTCKVGVWLSRNSTSSRCTFSRIVADHFSDTGIALAYTTTASNMGDLRANSIGSVDHETYGIKTNYTIGARTGGDFSTSQRTVVSVDTLPPVLLTNQARYAYLNGEFYQITAVDNVANTITVFGFVDYLAPTTGRMAYIFGSAVYIAGGDSSALVINSIDSTWCGVTLVDSALYGATVGTVVSQECGVGIALADLPQSAHIGGSCASLYVENVKASLIVNTYAAINYTVFNSYEHFFTKLKKSVITRNTSNIQRGGTFLGLVVGNGLGYTGEIKHQSSNSSVSFSDANNKIKYTGLGRYGLSVPITLNENIVNSFNMTETEVVVTRDADVVIPYVEFKAPVGYTFKGDSLVNTYTDFVGAPRFFLTVDTKSKVITITGLTEMKNVTQVNLVDEVEIIPWVAPPTALLTKETTTISTNIASLKDYAADDLNISLYPEVSGVTVGWVTEANSAYIAIYVMNHTSGTLDLTGVNLRVVKRKYTDRLLIPEPVEPLLD